MTNVFIVSAPSGSGKSTLVRMLLDQVPGLVFSISYTTRAPRGKEQDGLDYFFVSPDEFQRMHDAGEFLESAIVFGKHSYGTARHFLDIARATGQDLLLDIDVQGAQQVREKMPGTVSVFILPPSRQVLEHRLRQRGEDTEAVIERRLRQAATEIQGYKKYDYVLINKELDRASQCMNAIVLATRTGTAEYAQLAEGCRISAVQDEIQPILDTFESQSKERCS